jgi:predicted RecB family nuclease
MPSQARTGATILAHHLYDFAECEHRIALDASLERARQTPPDEAMELLFEHGRRFEREVVAPLGYSTVAVEDGDWAAAAEQTLALMRAGVDGIDQGALLDGGRLARPDLLERVAGASRLGEYHYVPGDVKSARTTRSDAVLQVGFAALLLEAAQGRRPEMGFLILGDRRREILDLESIRCTVDDAVARAEAIASGDVATTPFFSPACARCRWRGECLPRLEAKRDVSFVHGMTRSRHRVLVRNGVATIDALANADVAALVAAGVPSEGLERARAQASALLRGAVLRRRPVALPRGRRRELYLRIETDPLDRGEPFSIALAEGPRGGATLNAMRVAVISNADERGRGLAEVVESSAVRDEPIYVFGSSTARAFDALAEAGALEPARAGDIAGRFVDLAPWVRRAGVFPVFLYGFDDVGAVVRNLPRPAPGVAHDAHFVRHASLAAAENPHAVRSELEAAGRDALESLRAIRAWMAPPGRGDGAP